MTPVIELKTSVRINPRFDERLKRAPEIVDHEMKRAMEGATALAIVRIREYMRRIGLTKSGHLAGSLADRVELRPRGARGIVESNERHAGVQEFGGTIRAPSGRLLFWVTEGARPTTPEGWRLARRAGHVGVARRVRIQGKAPMRRGLNLAVPRIRELFREAAERALARMVHGGGGD